MIPIYFCRTIEGKSVEELLTEEEYVERFFNGLFATKIQIMKRNTETGGAWIEYLTNLPRSGIVVFSNDWEDSKFCRLEMEICKTFGYAYIVLE